MNDNLKRMVTAALAIISAISESIVKSINGGDEKEAVKAREHLKELIEMLGLTDKKIDAMVRDRFEGTILGE